MGTPDRYYWRGLEAATLIETVYRFASPEHFSSAARSPGVARDDTIASNGLCPVTIGFDFSSLLSQRYSNRFNWLQDEGSSSLSTNGEKA